ncbi:hypothetical protein CR513_21877, partial [Mucuna pruriens]
MISPHSYIKFSITKYFNFIHCSLRLKHPGLFVYSDLLDMSWHKGVHDSDLLLTYRYHRPLNLGPLSLTIKHSVSPEVGIHGIPLNKFSHSLCRGVRLSKLSIGYDSIEPSESDSSKGKATARFHFTHNGGRSISTDRDGFSLTRRLIYEIYSVQSSGIKPV